MSHALDFFRRGVRQLGSDGGMGPGLAPDLAAVTGNPHNIYAVVVEGILSIIPAVVNELTVSYYLRSLGWTIADLPLPAEAVEDFEREVAPLVVGADVQTALFALAMISLVTLSLSAWIIHRREWPLTEGV